MRELLVVVAALACGGERLPSRSPPPDLEFARGESLYRQLAFDSARAVWSAALDRATREGDSARQARLLTEIALANWRLGRLGESRQLHTRAIALKERLRLGDSALSRSLNGLGLVAYREGRLDESVALFERAIATARAAGDAAGLAKAYGNLGLPQQELGDLARARTNYRTMLEIGRTLRDRRFEANALLNLASVDIWSGDPAPAIARLDSARLLYRAIGYRTGEQEALAQRATAFELTGAYDSAFAALDSSLALTRTLGDAEEEGDLLRLMAGLHGRVGGWRQAIRDYEQADSLARQSGAGGLRGDIARGLATAFLNLGNLERARREGERALAAHTASGQLAEQLDDLLLLADLASRRREPRRAREALREGRAIAQRLDTRGALLAVQLTEAQVAERLQDTGAMLGALRAAAPLVDPSDLPGQAELNALATRAYAASAALDSAAQAGRRAVAALERMRANLGTDALRSALVADRASTYGDVVLVLLRQGRSDEAFAIADAARSRSLIEHVASAREGARGATFADGEDLLRKIDALVQRLRNARPDAMPQRAGPTIATAPAAGAALRDSSTDALVRAIANARAEYEEQFVRAAQREPRASTLLGVRPVRLDDLRATLQPDETLLEFHLAREHLVTFVVRRDGFRVLEQRYDPVVLSNRVGMLRDVWGTARTDWRLGSAASQALYRQLVGPARDAGLLEGASRLVVVPHGVLAQLPYAALQDEDGAFLVDRFAVTELPSGAALAAVRRRGVTAPAARRGGVGLAPFPDQLPASADEVRAFGARVPHGDVLLSERATEGAARAALVAPAPLHIATHATFNVRNPMFSRIDLFRPRSRGAAATGDDGRLEVHEILALDVRSPLVFFSGCETGAGRTWEEDPMRGTADLSLAQAVLAAGAHNVVSTLWRIDDAGAARFAALFYERLLGASAADALAGAQRALRREAAYASPYFWAGYVLSGEGQFGRTAQTAAQPSVIRASP